MLRRWMTTMVAIGAITLFGACTTTQEEEVSTTTEMGAEGEIEAPGAGLPAWEALVSKVAETDVHGEVAVRATTGGDTFASISLDGEAGANYPWHVHAGECGSGGPIVGSATAYPVIGMNAEGEGTAEATLDVALDPEADYYINVHASPDDLGTIVACGELHTTT